MKSVNKRSVRVYKHKEERLSLASLSSLCKYLNGCLLDGLNGPPGRVEIVAGVSGDTNAILAC
jgi:hypothetical protein